MCSMLSAQVDKLRERAKELRSLAPDPAVSYLVPSTKETMALAMRSAASEMEDAADTIWELRGMVHKERAEAKKLRASNEVIAEDHAALCKQNAKLRELVLHMYTCMGNVDADGNHECFSCEYEDTECDFAGRMAQLGIGVGE